ncbi:BCAR1 protein, partial [Atractosteus spatula]|nr:BCAR1 protein [Atractosteus spatula]
LSVLQNVLAKALYDNVAESPDELSFRKGDIMTVLERDTQGLDGWWLCSLHGRQGIVPGNRLKILVGMYDKKQPAGKGPGVQQGTPTQSPLPFPQQNAYTKPPPSSQYTAMHPAYPSQPDSIYMLPPNHAKGSQSLYQVPTGPHGQDIYQVPPSLGPSQDIYQVPPTSKGSPQDIYQVPPSAGGPGQDIYQVPPSMNQTQDIYQTPPSLEKGSWDSPKPPGKVRRLLFASSPPLQMKRRSELVLGRACCCVTLKPLLTHKPRARSATVPPATRLQLSSADSEAARWVIIIIAHTYIALFWTLHSKCFTGGAADGHSAHLRQAELQLTAVVVPTRVGQVYVYENPKTEQDEYDVPRHLPPSQEIYDVPPARGQYNQQPEATATGLSASAAVDRSAPWSALAPVAFRAAQCCAPATDSPPEPGRAGALELLEQDSSRQAQNELPTGSMLQSSLGIPLHLPVSAECHSARVYDTPPMVVKGPPSREGVQEIYDTPPIVEKSHVHTQQTVYDFPPSVSKDVPDGPIREETYDVPPHFVKMKKSPESKPHQPLVQPQHPEDVYDVPPLSGKQGDATAAQEIYDIPPSLRKERPQDVYDFPREHPAGGRPLGGEDTGDYIYDVPPQVVRDAASTEELTISFKRLSASSTGSTRSNLSTSSLDIIPVKESSVTAKPSGRELQLDLDVAMEVLVKLQHSVESSVSSLMSFISSSWRSPEQMEANLQGIRAAVERVKSSVKDLLEFARGAVANAAQATDRTLQAKLSKQVQKMEEGYQGLLKHSQALDNCNWALSVLVAGKTSSGDDLDRLVMCSRGVPDDTKQLASFLHGNASLLFKRTKQQAPHTPQLGDSRHTFSQAGLESLGQVTNNNNISAYQTGLPEKANIQSRPLPSPPKFMAEDTLDSQYENTEGGWMEDYDYVHLQGKEEFEKNQKELLEKGNIIRQGKAQLAQQQLKQFERLEQEVTRPIDNDMTNWTPPSHYPPSRSKLSPGDRQLLLFYAEQCEANITTLNNAIDAFYSSINNNQPPKIFVAHSKFVILSAHKLVFIGDTLSRQAKALEIRNKVTQHSNLLCDKLKEIVVTTKTAALQYPSATAAKDMIDRVRDLANSTQQFRMVLSQMASL